RRCSEPPSRPNKSCDGPKSQLLRAPARPPPGGPAPGETLDKRSTDRTRKLTMKKSRTSSHKTRLTTKSPYKLAFCSAMLADGGGTQQRKQKPARTRLDSVMVCDAAGVSCHTLYFPLRRRATRCPCRLWLSRPGTRRFSACARSACPQRVIERRGSH